MTFRTKALAGLWEHLLERTQHQLQRCAELVAYVAEERGLGTIDFGQRIGALVGPFPVLDVECGHIPPYDTSLLIEQGLVAHQEPAILPIAAQNTLFSAEWCATPQPCLARLADSLEILRVDDTIPIILLLYILNAEACVIHHSLIHILDGSFGVQYVDVCRNGVEDQA